MGDVSDFCDSLLKDEAVMRALETHPAIVDAAQHIEEILQEPEYYTSIIIALRHAGRAFPRRIISLIGVKRENVPALSTEWLEILLTHAFYGDDQLLPLADEEKKRIRSRLSRIGAVERRKVCLKNTKGFTKTLMQSMSKLSSVVDIVRLESETLKNALRLVILSDFIRAEDLPRDPADIKPVTRMGVIPIFEELRRKEDLDVKLGCLCGTMIIIPRASVDDLHRIASEHQMALNTIRCVSLPADERYVEVDLEGRTDEKAVMLITQLFTEGGITVLVGTKSLLGEGWDAPCINALILASFVGSFVLSNQMRGRAIRTYKNDIGKTANVWHLVCVQETRNPFDRRLDLGPDWEMVKRRFKAFVGVSYRETIIENGFERLGITIDDRRR
ncbi:MAG: restriction endonuclease subunit R, partial [Candidatus Omnitrophota bacterium]